MAMNREAHSVREWGAGRLRGLAALSVLLILFGVPVLAQGEHVLLGEEDLTWQAGPPSIPPGAEFVVLEGVPSEEGPFTMRLRLPAGYEIAPHSHTGIEHITVLSGSFNIGMGDEFDREQTEELVAGSFGVMPVGMTHFVWIGEETLIQLHGMGPWTIEYVNPQDDPRNQ